MSPTSRQPPTPDHSSADHIAPTAVICDLGGVVIRIDADRVRDRWAARSSLPREQVHAAFPDDAYRAFERDELSVRQYLDHVRTALQLAGTDAELADDFNQIFLAVDAGTLRILQALRGRDLTLVALTNTNRIHASVWSRRFAAELAVFEAIHCSHDLRARKPDPRAFTAVLEHHDLDPARTVFVDDLPRNVDAARRLGLRGIVFHDAAQLGHEIDALVGGRTRTT